MAAQTLDAPAPPIATHALRKVFKGGRSGDVVAVDELNLTVSAGEFFGLLGPNGAGKSTTIGMLTTRVVPTSGRAEIAGIDVTRHPAAAKRSIGVVPQTNTLDRQLTVAENLEFHGRYFGMKGQACIRRTAELLEQFRLADRAKAPVMALSGGMAQRLMIARALVHKPDVLFLDEPTSGIDPQTRLTLWDLLRELHGQGQTILLTTHYMEEADTLCQRVAIIDHGKVLADDTPEELKRSLGAGTVMTLVLDGGDVERLRGHAESLDGVESATLDANTLSVTTSASTGMLADLVAHATSYGLRIGEATSTPPTLESVFLSLTGRELRE